MSKAKWVYVPKLCTGDDAKFAGKFELSIPTFEERWGYIDEASLELNEEGAIDAKKMTKNIGSLVKLVKAAKKHIVSIDIEKKGLGIKYCTIEELETDADCDGLLFELGALMMNGFRPGKN